MIQTTIRKNYSINDFFGRVLIALADKNMDTIAKAKIKIILKNLVCNEFNKSLYSRIILSKKIALISGAGIAGLATTFELLASGFNVILAEMRSDFTRFNVINLNVEAQVFLKKFHLLEEFEKYVAARIKEHRYVVIGKKGEAQRLGVSDVSQLKLDPSVSFEPNNVKELFKQDGIYSVKIADLQSFLAEKALQAGARIFGKVEVAILSRTKKGGVSKAEIVRTEDRTQVTTVKPDLLFIAEGAHSKTVKQILKTKEIINECTGESWIFGNLKYSGKESFVVSVIDTSQKILKIANVIFNGKKEIINVAVTANKVCEQLLRDTVKQVFEIENILGSLEILNISQKPVHVKNIIASDFSIDNIFGVGDAVYRSSPLAGLGGTECVTLTPVIIRQLLDGLIRASNNSGIHFKKFSKASGLRWIEKSQSIKKFCIETFNKEQMLMEGDNQNEN